MQREKGKELLRKAVGRLDERLWHQLEEVWRLAQEGVHDAQRSENGHQQGTPHCLAVEENLAALIPDDWKGMQFTATDLFVLSAAAALHDLGKASDSPDDHGHVSMWEVRDRAMTFGLDEGQAEVVGWIVRAHNDGDLDPLPAEPVPLGTVEVDPRPLAALFKTADVLHTDYRRVSRQVVEFGGKQPEDNPKTRFRLRVRGWRFDDQGRIQLYAVPKDWDEVAVINTGFEMTRRELEPVVPTLQDIDLPWELDLHVDDTDLERRAREEVEAERRSERAFVGMDYFTETDAPRFKGRDDDAQVLWRRVTGVPVTLLVGDSGVGKTSLIHAGLFPLLHQARWRTSYVRPFDNPDYFVVRSLWRDLIEGEPPDDVAIVDTLAQASKAVGTSKLLVVLDQFEDVIRVPAPEMLDGVRRALVAVQAGRFRNLRLLVSYRADAEAALGPLFQAVSGSDRGLPRNYLQPLSHAGARAALEVGFAEAQVAVGDPMLDTIAGELEIQTPTPGVYPPYVQMVGETLCQAAHDENKGILTEKLYREKGGCKAIIGRYLLQRLAKFGERRESARRVLVALVRSTGVKGQQSLDGLQVETGLNPAELMPLLDGLVDKRMIRHLGGGQYEIAHDYLARLVDEKIVGAEERHLKELRELLDLKARAYTTKHVPLMPPDMARLYTKRERISPNSEQIRLLLHSCLLEQGPAWFWLQDPSEDRYLPLLRDALASPIATLRRVTVPVAAQVSGREVVPVLRRMLGDQDGSVREAAGRGLTQILQPVQPDDISDLRLLLKSQDQRVRCTALEMLVQVAGLEAIPELREMLSDRDSSVREAARQTLVKLVQRVKQKAIPCLQEMLEERDGYVRRTAVEALAYVAEQRDIATFQELLKHRAWYVRRSAIEVLVQIGGRRAIPDLREMLKDRASHVRRSALELLVQIAEREAIPDLREMLKDQNKVVLKAAEQALIQILQQAEQEDIPELHFLRGVDQLRVRRRAGRVLVHVLQQVGPGAIPDLRALLKDRDRTVREAAVQALANALQQIGQEAIPELRELLENQSGEARRAAAGALVQVLQQLGPEAIPEIRGLLRDQDSGVQEMAKQALCQVYQQMGQEAISSLRDILEDPEIAAQESEGQELPLLTSQKVLFGSKHLSMRRVTGQALIKILQQMGREAIPDLRELLKDRDWEVREAAGQALVEIMLQMGQEAIPDLQALCEIDHYRVGGRAEQALVEIYQQMGREGISGLREMLKAKHIWARLAAVGALAQVAGQEAIPDLREMLKDRDEFVRERAARHLITILEEVGVEAIPDLWVLLKARKGQVRLAAAQALAKTVGWKAVPDLQRLLNDRAWYVRHGVREALTQVFQQVNREAIPDLRKILRDQNQYLRRAAVQALARVAGREAVPDLREMLRVADWEMRFTVPEVLKELVTEDDVTWLAEWVARYPLAETGKAANRLLIHLDRKLYCPFEWPE